MSKLKQTCIMIALLLAIIALPALPAVAQSTVDGAIAGTIKDPNGALVPNATVTVRNEETNKEETINSDTEGRFRVVALAVGNYTVRARAAGFGEYSQEHVVVEIGRVNTLEIALAVAGTSGVVSVTSEAPVINTAQQDFSTNINQTSINELPINGRRAANFAILSPASVPDGNFGLISYRGISGLLNNNTVDGGDNNQALFSEERGRTRIPYGVSQGAVREFQVNTSNYSAEYGRAAGAVVNTVTKSGTNEFHGSAFEYYRNNKFGARNPRATQTIFTPGQPLQIVGIKPQDVRNQFGGTIGGPIIHDKLFFFFSADYQRRDFPGLGVFSSPSYLTTVNRPLLTGKGLTNAQIDSTLSFLTSLTGEVPRRGDQNLYLPKIDWTINSKNNFSATFNHLRWTSPAGIQTQATNTLGRASFGDDFVHVDWLTLRLTSTLRSNLLNEARFQWGRDDEFETSQPPLPGEPTTSPGGRSPDVFLTNGIEFGKPTFLERRAFPDERRQQYADTMTWTRGSHTVKFGGDINRVSDILDNLRFEGGSYSYSNINDFIIDYVNFQTPLAANVTCATQFSGANQPVKLRGRCYTSNYQQAFGPTRFIISTTDLNFFIQDDWRVTQKLTLNLGLRYEYEHLPAPQIPSSDPALIPNVGISIAQATSHFPADRNNWGPRFGFAYDLKGDGKMSLRGGFGIYYGRINNGQIFNAVANTGNPAGQFSTSLPLSVTSGGVTTINPALPVFPNVITQSATGASAVAIQYFSPQFAAPEISEYDLVFEREIAANTAVSVSYVGSQGRKLPTFLDRNLNYPTQTRTLTVADGPFAGQVLSFPVFSNPRPLPTYGAITEISSTVRSEYDGLVLQANRRLTKGLQFQTSYTLSKATDTGQISQTFTATNVPFNVFDPTLDNGTSNFDVRHKFVFSAVWVPDKMWNLSNSAVGRAIFGGWTIAPVVQIFSGRPYTGLISASAGGTPAGGINGSGGLNQFPLLRRNTFRQPAVKNVDLRISRRFRFTETKNLEFLADFFNLFNSTQTGGVATTFYANGSGAQASTLFYQSSFGTINDAGGGSSFYRERQIQFAVRFEF